ncbi:MAG: hypothetical protein AAB767_04350 [Patescibacteria group bacterium]
MCDTMAEEDRGEPMDKPSRGAHTPATKLTDEQSEQLLTALAQEELLAQGGS